MIGRGTPKSQSSAPRPNPMTYSRVLSVVRPNNAEIGAGVPCRDDDAGVQCSAKPRNNFRLL